jgi:hypothetical protein
MNSVLNVVKSALKVLHGAGAQTCPCIQYSDVWKCYHNLHKNAPILLSAKPPNNLIIEPITEERANRCLARIDLLNKVREEVLLHPRLDERMELCQSSFDMPDWWVPGVHDKDLMIGAAR